MKLASFRIHNRATWGQVEGSIVRDLGAALGERIPDLRSCIEQQADELVRQAGASAPSYSLEEVSWLPVIPNPEKIFCVGLNYETHRKETGRAVVEHPTIFARFANTQTGHLTNIVRPRVSTHLDFEGELAVIIGKEGRYISREQAFAHVAGFSCYNDGSVRDWQHHTHQFTPGKNFPGTGGFGPWMVTSDEIPDPSRLTLVGRLNKVEMQRTSTDLMIFDIPTLIAYITTFTELVPGDVISTGTPGGVGSKRQPPVWLKAGDVFEVEISGIGVLRNTVIDEPAAP
jgi:2-keto-4-pentenoate hydratase/2-oxohepta-3-ene-1,7-dioic acid hydratase in catechol pathway